MKWMKRCLLLLLFPGALAWGQDLSAIHTVYLLPMGRGLDQYLASRLTQEHVFQVVTDPKRADAVFTDRIGKSLDDTLADLTAKPNPEPVAKPDEAKPPDSLASPTVNKLENLSANSSFARGKGTIFLVDPKSRQVLWSAYRPSKDSSSSQLDHTASDIVSRLKRDLKPKEAR